MNTFQKVLEGMKILAQYEPQEVIAEGGYIEVNVDVAPSTENVEKLQHLDWCGRAMCWTIEVDPI